MSSDTLLTHRVSLNCGNSAAQIFQKCVGNSTGCLDSRLVEYENRDAESCARLVALPPTSEAEAAPASPNSIVTYRRRRAIKKG